MINTTNGTADQMINRRIDKDGLPPKEPTGYESPAMWLWFGNTPKLKSSPAPR